MAAAYLSIAPTASAHTHLPKQFSAPKFISTSRLSFTSIPTTSPCRPLSTLNHKKVIRITAQVQVQEALQSGKLKQEFERKLYVGNIPRTLTNEELAKIFVECGAVEKAEVMYDKYSRRSRRFGFVTMSTVEDAQAAAEKLNGTEIGGREIKRRGTFWMQKSFVCRKQESHWAMDLFRFHQKLTCKLPFPHSVMWNWKENE